MSKKLKKVYKKFTGGEKSPFGIKNTTVGKDYGLGDSMAGKSWKAVATGLSTGPKVQPQTPISPPSPGANAPVRGGGGR